MTPCAGQCGQHLDLGDARPCAILVCKTCRAIPSIFRKVRYDMTKHIKAHMVEERKTNPFYPFPNFDEAWAYT